MRGGLMVGAVDRKFVGANDFVQQGIGGDRDGMTGFVTRVGLFVGEGIRDGVRDVLHQRAAQYDVQQLLAAANAEDRFVAR